MVKKHIKTKNRAKQAKKRRNRKVQSVGETRVPSIGANTLHEFCTERLSAFGGLLSLVKFLDLIGFKEVFEKQYVKPKRNSALSHYRMVLGLLMLLYIGFQRIGHFVYIREDSMLCGILKVVRLPVVSTFWRYLQSLTIIQSQSILRIMGTLRERVWLLAEYQPESVEINIDTTVATVYGDQQGACKGHNPKHRGKKGFRPVLCFLQETREYLCGKQRRGETLSALEISLQILRFKQYLPSCVKKVLVRGDGEFIGWISIQACLKRDYTYIFGNRRCTPPFAKEKWYSHEEHEYNECSYQPLGWEAPCRFVAMRICKDPDDPQGLLFEDPGYTYRIFVTNREGFPHRVIALYDKRADVENSIGEAQGEGILAIPSKNFQSNHAYFQIVMLAYNLWRWIKILVSVQKKKRKSQGTGESQKVDIADHTIRIARLKLLFIAVKLSFHSNRDKVSYSIHDNRASEMKEFLDYLDEQRRRNIKWRDPITKAA